MKLSKMLAAAAAVLALMAFASTASATTLETNGVTQTGAVTLEWSLVGSFTYETTTGAFANTCSVSTWQGTTSVFTGTTVGGSVSALSVSNCTHSPIVISSKGSFSVERIGTTTNGTVRTSGLTLTVPVTIFGSVVSVTCTTSNTDLGTLTGLATGTAHLSVNASIICGGTLPSIRWTATYALTTSSGAGHAIGVVA